ncbi:BURP domain protein [Medicago truncatula]|uniref:BURP domain protein n=1 Tax=Medicago truncatula TaxID=3880 RepID=G7JZ05_MEDTR|nr:BURP domain protein [Medicago truncatula]
MVLKRRKDEGPTGAQEKYTDGEGSPNGEHRYEFGPGGQEKYTDGEDSPNGEHKYEFGPSAQEKYTDDEGSPNGEHKYEFGPGAQENYTDGEGSPNGEHKYEFGPGTQDKYTDGKDSPYGEHSTNSDLAVPMGILLLSALSEFVLMFPIRTAFAINILLLSARSEFVLMFPIRTAFAIGILHQEMFPFMLLYFCHYIPMGRFYEVEILDLQKIMINQAVDVCHLNTSSWCHNHPALLNLARLPVKSKCATGYTRMTCHGPPMPTGHIRNFAIKPYIYVYVRASMLESKVHTNTSLLIKKVHTNTSLLIQIKVQYKCHQEMFPFMLLYFCHYIPMARFCEVEILDLQKIMINQVVDVCHLNTSSWSRNHPAFVELGSTPGEIEVCHWIYKNDLSWTADANWSYKKFYH